MAKQNKKVVSRSMPPLSFEDEDEYRRRIICSFLLLSDRPIASKIKYQKGLFLLTRSFPKFNEFFEFKKHMLGPYSEIANDLLDEGNNELIIHTNRGISLSDDGKRLGQETIDDIMDLKKQGEYIKAIKFIYSIINRVTDEELMFLIYKTYGYYEASMVYEDLLKKKEELSQKLYNKGIISHSKYQELIACIK